MRQHDDDDRPKYECSSCPALIRATRQCTRWPPPEVQRLMEIAPDKVPSTTTRSGMLALLKTTAWQPGEERGLATAVHEGLHYPTTAGLDPCPVLEITEPTARFLRHYARCQSFGSGMGGMVQPGDDIQSSSLRDVHAFTMIHNESERLRKIERAKTKDP